MAWHGNGISAAWACHAVHRPLQPQNTEDIFLRIRNLRILGSRWPRNFPSHASPGYDEPTSRYYVRRIGGSQRFIA